jgi:hypothetical protein
MYLSPMAKLSKLMLEKDALSEALDTFRPCGA